MRMGVKNTSKVFKKYFYSVQKEFSYTFLYSFETKA